MPWVLLVIGGLFEVGFTTALRFVDGFRNLPWTLVFLGSVTASMGLLEVAARSIPMAGVSPSCRARCARMARPFR